MQAPSYSLSLITPEREYQCCGVWFQPHCLAVLENLEHSLPWHPSQKCLQMPPKHLCEPFRSCSNSPVTLRSNPAANDFPCNPTSSVKSHRAKAQSKTESFEV